jgi:uncharacterized protein DUF3500
MNTMKRLALSLMILGLLLAGATAWSARRDIASGKQMVDAADGFVKSLDASQQSKAVMSYDAPERRDWHFIPKPTRKGLQVREMSTDQRKQAHALLQAALSQVGYGKATKIMALEGLLAELEKTREKGPLRDPERYYFTVFGQPSADGRWGLSVEGHHLSLNFVVDHGKVISSTPMTFAANPAIVKTDAVSSIPKGTRILEREESLAMDLLASLTPEQRGVAVIAEKAPAEMRAAGEPQPPTDLPEGLKAEKLNGAQQKMLRDLLSEYANNAPEDVAGERLAKLEAAGLGNVYFAWAGSDRLGEGHYYRVQGSTFLIEFVNTQPDSAGNPANHIHSIWRDMAGDFAVPIGK